MIGYSLQVYNISPNHLLIPGCYHNRPGWYYAIEWDDGHEVGPCGPYATEERAKGAGEDKGRFGRL
jgi:hypothetical protein